MRCKFTPLGFETSNPSLSATRYSNFLANRVFTDVCAHEKYKFIVPNSGHFLLVIENSAVCDRKLLRLGVKHAL